MHFLHCRLALGNNNNEHQQELQQQPAKDKQQLTSGCHNSAL